MAATVQTYSLTATWTAAQLATVFRSMLIDAGLMSDWYDSQTASSYEHRILRLTNDGAQTYGYQFIWFVFHTGGVYVQFANGWNASTHVPTGTVNLDYLTTSCSATTTNFSQILTLSTAQTYTFVRYTSGTSSVFSSSAGTFAIKSSIGTVPSWLDLSKVSAFSFFTVTTANSGTTNGWRLLYFSLPFQIQRMLFAGRAYSGSYNQKITTSSYHYGGISTTTDVNDATASSYIGSVRLPSFASAINTAYASNYTPIVTGIDMFPLLDCKLSDDFGIVTTLGLAPAARDTITVTAGVEVWEVITSVASSSTNGMCLLARTT